MPGTARRAFVEPHRRDQPERRRRGGAWLLDLLPESRANPRGLLDRVCAEAEATARGEGAFSVLPDGADLLAHALLALAAQRHGLTLMELAALFPSVGRAARRAVAWLRGEADGGGGGRAWGEYPAAAGRHHGQTRRGPRRIGGRARRRRRGAW